MSKFEVDKSMITSEKGRCIILIEKKSLSDLVLITKEKKNEGAK